MNSFAVSLLLGSETMGPIHQSGHKYSVNKMSIYCVYSQGYLFLFFVFFSVFADGSPE